MNESGLRQSPKAICCKIAPTLCKKVTKTQMDFYKNKDLLPTGWKQTPPFSLCYSAFLN
jgi:hypothetical protein